MHYTIGTVQAQDIQNDIHSALNAIDEALQTAEAQKIDILCFPECFLQGYTFEKAETKKRALRLDSPEFSHVRRALAAYKPLVILGVIEEANGQYFNTAVVLEEGEVVGTYRKMHLFEENFEPGEDSPVFTDGSLDFGINICYDACFPEGAQLLAMQGAKLIFYPLNNRLPKEKAQSYRDKHIAHLVARAKETGCWIISSDVIGEDEISIGSGCSVIINPQGDIVERVRELGIGIVMTDVVL
jgi:predicted amidohydrolase